MIVETPSRLHLGIIDLSRSFPREYGALGLMVKGGYRIEVATAEEGVRIDGSQKEKKEIQDIYGSLKEAYPIRTGFHVDVKRGVPRHIGLGSTTQLKMGTAAAMMKLSGIGYDIEGLADAAGRSRFSAIGTYGFLHGGFILEGGKRNPDEVPPLSTRMDIPEDWRFVVVWPESRSSYDEVQEKPIMKNVKVSKEYPQRISHHIVMGVLPSLVHEDIESFAHHISRIQRAVGESFSKYQGGTFHPAVAEAVELLEDITYGAGQSSWGPTAYGITTADKASGVKDEIEIWSEETGLSAEIWIAEPDNEGAVFHQ